MKYVAAALVYALIVFAVARLCGMNRLTDDS